MSSKRVKIRPLAGGINPDTREQLSKILFEKLKVKYARIVEAGDCFAVVCLDESNVDLLISTSSITTLRQHRFDIVLPPHLRARKCIVVRWLDSDLHKWTVDQLREDLEARNGWAKIDEVYKMGNIDHMIKIRFTEIAMAKKACDEGLAIHRTHIARHQIEPEEFIPITPCWSCYKYDHSVNDCPTKNIIFCSECSAIGHTYKNCTSTTKKCLNCEGDHRTLASICPIRKEILKQKRNEKKQKQVTFERDNRTYCAVTKLSTELPRQIQSQKPPETILQVSDKLSLQVLVIIAEAHVYNMVKPGTFARRVNHLLELNGLPKVILPDDAPSNDIFNVINRLPEYAATPDEEMEEQEELEEIDEEPAAAAAAPTTRVSATTTSTTTTTKTTERETVPTQSSQAQTQRHQQQQQQAQPTAVRPKEQRSMQQKRVTQQPKKMDQAQGKQQQSSVDIGLQFYSNEKGILDMTPDQLYRAIREGRVKFTYTESRISESDILRYIKDGTLTTDRNKIRTVDVSVYKKIRTGLARSPSDTAQKQKQKFSSQ